MQVSLESVMKKFQEVMSKKISREEANNWAYSIMEKSESEEIEFFPAKDEKIIWEGVMYLYGFDLLVEPGQYLLSCEEMQEEFDNLFRGKDCEG